MEIKTDLDNSLPPVRGDKVQLQQVALNLVMNAAEVIVMVMTQKAIDSLYTTSVKLGGDMSIAAGPYGAGAKGDVTADFISYAKSKGLYAGLNLEGSVVGVRESLNKDYYGEAATPVQIIVEKKVSSKGSAGLREALQKTAK